MTQDAVENQESKVKLQMPVLAIGGDRAIGNLVIHEIQQVAENVQGVIINNCKHWVAEKQPELLAEKLLAFFEQS